MSRIRALCIPLALALATPACAQQPAPTNDSAQAAAQTPVYGFRIVATYPHDRRAFTQGLLWRDGHLYESTGQIGQSTIRRVNLEDGRVLQSVSIPAGQFGEGIVDWGDQLINLSWQNGVGYRWDLRTLRRLSEWRYSGEGWGLTRSDREIFMSDGTHELRVLDPTTLAERGRIQVTDQGTPVPRLNELEWVNGEIFANVWMTPMIARIDPASGRVTGWIDLTALAIQNGADQDSVLNGIAYDAARDRLFVTGKYWERLYEIDLVPPAAR